MSYLRPIIFAVAAVTIFAGPLLAQTKRRAKPVPKNPIVTTVAPAPSPSPEKPATVKTEPKKNERPSSGMSTQKSSSDAVTPQIDPTYLYEFAQPDFMITKIVIGHDEAGRGTITFTKKMFGDTVTDPLQVSPAALERINSAYAALNFVDSTENYQYEKDYSHLGVMTFRLKKGGKQRTVVFNYTVNKDAKILSDEYRKLGNQFIWMFDVSVARENQPLETPKLLDSLDSLIRRDEISDPSQMVSFLKGLTDDERIPLIARNHAGKLVERIEKNKK